MNNNLDVNWINQKDVIEKTDVKVRHDAIAKSLDLSTEQIVEKLTYLDYDKAKQTLKMATTVNPNYSKGYANLGVIYSEEEEWNQAISSLEMAVALNERDAMSYFRLSGAHNMNGDCKSALEAARKSTELKNRFGGAWFELGTAEWCSGSGNKAGALNAFEKARNDRSWRKMAEYEIDKIKNPQKYIK